MKISGAKKIHYDSGPNMTPLVDVVMVILIFLMLAGSFGTVEKYLVSNSGLQSSSTSKAVLPPNFIPPTNVIVQVDIDPDSVAEADSAGLTGTDKAKALRYMASVAGTTYKSYDSLRAKLGELAVNPAYKDKSNVQIVISPRLAVLHRHLIDVYQAALDAGFTKIAFATAR